MANNRSLGTRLREWADGLRSGFMMLTASERRNAVLLVISSLFNAFLQTAVLVSIIPMVTLMIDPSNVPTGRAPNDDRREGVSAPAEADMSWSA